MRVINLDRLKLPEHWQDRADAAIADEQDKINDHSDVWRDLKDPLKELSNDKCYYCEVIQERADGAVDHFRPKKNYPWSVFLSTNYRFACTFCNSRRTEKKTKEPVEKEKISLCSTKPNELIVVAMKRTKAPSF